MNHFLSVDNNSRPVLLIPVQSESSRLQVPNKVRVLKQFDRLSIPLSPMFLQQLKLNRNMFNEERLLRPFDKWSIPLSLICLLSPKCSSKEFNEARFLRPFDRFSIPLSPMLLQQLKFNSN